MADPTTKRRTTDDPPDASLTYRITGRQLEALYWLSLGLTRAGIARKLDVSENTAQTLIRGTYRNLNVGSAAEAVRVGFEAGLLRVRAPLNVHVTRRYATPRGRQSAPNDLRLP